MMELVTIKATYIVFIEELDDNYYVLGTYKPNSISIFNKDWSYCTHYSLDIDDPPNSCTIRDKRIYIATKSKLMSLWYNSEKNLINMITSKDLIAYDDELFLYKLIQDQGDIYLISQSKILIVNDNKNNLQLNKKLIINGKKAIKVGDCFWILDHDRILYRVNTFYNTVDTVDGEVIDFDINGNKMFILKHNQIILFDVNKRTEVYKINVDVNTSKKEPSIKVKNNLLLLDTKFKLVVYQIHDDYALMVCNKPVNYIHSLFIKNISYGLVDRYEIFYATKTGEIDIKKIRIDTLNAKNRGIIILITFLFILFIYFGYHKFTANLIWSLLSLLGSLF